MRWILRDFRCLGIFVKVVGFFVFWLSCYLWGVFIEYVFGNSKIG